MTNMDLQVVIQTDRLEVMFSNHGDDTIRIWEFYNSWGWHTIYLQVKNAISNEEFRLTKLKQMGWTINFPGFIGISAHARYIVDLFPREKGWESEQDLSVLKNQPLMVKAVLEIPETPEAIESGIFVGKAESEWTRSEPPHRWLFKEN
jgi:hypothetical protein